MNRQSTRYVNIQKWRACICKRTQINYIMYNPVVPATTGIALNPQLV